MSFKDDIAVGLETYAVSNLKVDREHVVNGVPSTLVSFNTRRGSTKYNHDFSFAKANQMDADHIISVIGSYLASAGTGE